MCVAGIAGMIVSSIADNNGAALTAGLMTAVAVLCLIVATAVSHDTGDPAADPPPTHDVLGQALENEIQSLVDGGSDERQVRQLVGLAVRFGRTGA